MPHGLEKAQEPRILFLDAYDSFSNNIVSLIKQHIAAEVCIIRIDDPRYLCPDNDDAFLSLLRTFDAVVAGPGPGSPQQLADVGLMARLWTLQDRDMLPVLGICLGFQSLALAYGATVDRLTEPRHGVVVRVEHQGQSIFRGARDVHVTLYNSLRADLGHGRHQTDNVEAGASQDDDMWRETAACPLLVPLAWVRDDADNGDILMAVRHATKPFWAVQYHPESICTNAAGASVVINWWTEVLRWSLSRKGHRRRRDSFLGASGGEFQDVVCPPQKDLVAEHLDEEGVLCRGLLEAQQGAVSWREVPYKSNSIESLLEALDKDGRNIVLASGTLSEGTPINSTTGRFSIVACLESHTIEQLSYNLTSRRVVHSIGDQVRRDVSVGDIWTFLDDFVAERRAGGGPECSPFWGGLIGFVSYEACLDTIDVEAPPADSSRPDVWFVFADRSVVVDHVERRAYVQTIRPNDQAWQQTIMVDLQQLDSPQRHPQLAHGGTTPTVPQTTIRMALPTDTATSPPPAPNEIAHVHGPTRPHYHSQIRACQSAIRAGDAYELCLTAQTHVSLPSPLPTPHQLASRLRRLNPAPFSAFLPLRLTSDQHRTSATIVSSSPERFMSWTRAGRVQFRPIKGTVRKSSKSSSGVTTTTTTRAEAEALLAAPKEQAENLMIVDLIRHDLAGALGDGGGGGGAAGGVRVTALMRVEELATLWQLVSVVEGELPPPQQQRDGARSRRSGVHVLRRCLPPGSMTGAPKRRACELLARVEGGRARGVYSGVLGYLDVGGGGDFSVVIRTAVRWGNGDDGDGADEDGRWTVGAGGAVTAQSTEEGEWEEMLAKRDALLDVFCGPDRTGAGANV